MFLCHLKKEFINLANFQHLNPKKITRGVKNDFVENSKKTLLSWPLWRIVTKFQSSRWSGLACASDTIIQIYFQI